MPEDFTSMLYNILGSDSGSVEGLYDSDSKDVQTDKEDSNDTRDPSDEQRAQRVMLNPPPEANTQEFRKALGTAQLTFSDTRAKLLDLTKRYNMLAGKMKAQRSRKGAKSSGPAASLEQHIIEAAKKYCLLYHLWVPAQLFPAKVQPGADIDPHGPSCWQTPDNWIVAEQAELYQMLPSELHKSLRTYPEFARIFSKAMTKECANIVKNIKDISVDLFADLGIESTLFSSDRSLKALDSTLTDLLQKPDTSKHTQLSPILFTDLSNLRGSNLLKSAVLVKIACVLMYGKTAIFGNKKRGGPKGRGDRMGVQSVTEGLIACTAMIARYLLSHDPEFLVKGEATSIEYQVNFEEYLKLLLQPERRKWALGVIDFFNAGVFGSKSQPASQLVNNSTGTSHVRSWEDKVLLETRDVIIVVESPPASPLYPSSAISNTGHLLVASNDVAEPLAF